MKSEETKQRYGFAYWFEKLVAAGKKIEPHKYNTDYVNKMRSAWSKQPITKLHLLTTQREQQANNQTTTPY